MLAGLLRESLVHGFCAWIRKHARLSWLHGFDVSFDARLENRLFVAIISLMIGGICRRSVYQCSLRTPPSLGWAGFFLDPPREIL
jgi:hypothetical protein|tara:strand:+ start:691 stop:945 length:255 start_codon:yes stop_codon:yes gene_type:complete